MVVVIYLLAYYRALGLVAVASLVIAAGFTYGLVVLLSATMGYTLTLAGVAGLVVAIGITADSFIVYFERIRDEMRDGRTMRVAVEAGWVRARRTIIAADFVSLIAAVVLYLLSVGGVRGLRVLARSDHAGRRRCRVLVHQADDDGAGRAASSSTPGAGGRVCPRTTSVTGPLPPPRRAARCAVGPTGRHGRGRVLMSRAHPRPLHRPGLVRLRRPPASLVRGVAAP